MWAWRRISSQILLGLRKPRGTIGKVSFVLFIKRVTKFAARNIEGYRCLYVTCYKVMSTLIPRKLEPFSKSIVGFDGR